MTTPNTSQASQITREALERSLQDLRLKNDDVRKKAAQSLRSTLEGIQRDSLADGKIDVFNDAYRYAFSRAQSLVVTGTETAERTGGIYALSAIVDLGKGELASKTTKVVSALRSVLRGSDLTAMVAAAIAMGKLAAPGGALTAELVDAEVKVALESLQVDRVESRRFAAVLTLRELAANSPTLLYQYVSEILEVIWVGLRDIKVLIREYSAEAIAALIEIIAARDALPRDKWFVRIYSEINKGFSQNTVETVHGSLLALKEMFAKGGMFMQTSNRYTDACDKVFLYRDHREPLIRREVTTIIPISAAYFPAEFSTSYLHKSMIHLQGQLKKEKDRNPAFVAIGKVASAVGSAIDPYLDNILVYVREGLSVKARNRSVNDAPIFECISMIAIAVGQTMTKYMDALLDPIFACGLSDALTQALVDMAHYIPPARSTIQEKLLDLLSTVLSGRPFQPLGSPHTNVVNPSSLREHREGQPVEHTEVEIALALQTLGSFDFSGKQSHLSTGGSMSDSTGSAASSNTRSPAYDDATTTGPHGMHEGRRHYIIRNVLETTATTTAFDPNYKHNAGYILNEFVHDVAIQYAEHDNSAIRKAAALTCCQLFVKDPIVHQVSRHAVHIVSGVIEKLLAVAVADPDPDIRHVVLAAMDPRFDRHLAKAENIRSLFLTLNDEVFANREAAMTIIGRLSIANPAYVFPALRKVLVQLLTEVEYSNMPRSKQESCQLISHLAASASGLIKPYVDPIVYVLLPRAKEADETVAATALRAIGDLSVIGAEDMNKYIPELMDLIVLDLQDLSSNAKRSAALRTLGQLASNSGYVIQPYIDRPELLTILVNIVKMEPPGELRRETIRLIGILGALDPYRHQTLLELSPESALVADAQAITDVSLIMGGLLPTDENYYPTVVITTLMNLLKDPSSLSLHQQIMDAVMNIYATLGMKCVQFLSQVIPGFMLVIHTSVSGRDEGFFSQLAQLVRIVRTHIRPYLPQIIDAIATFWPKSPGAHATMLHLIENIARALEGEFKIYLAQLLPFMLGVLDSDRSLKRGPSERVLHAFLVFGSSAEEYMHLIIPVIVRMFDTQSGQPTFLRKLAIETLGKLSRQVNLSEFAAKIIHPITRVLAGNDIQLRQAALDALCALIFQMGSEYLSFIPTVKKVLTAQRVHHANYSLIVTRLQKGEPLPQDLSPDAYYRDEDADQAIAEIEIKALAVNQAHLRAAWDTENRSTKDDWQEWMRKLNTELLKESPQHALRACYSLAVVHERTARALFNSAFISCYPHLFLHYQTELCRNMETALGSNNVPPDIVQTVLNLAEFMEHDDKALPIDVRTLGMYAGKCHAFAKALHYKELEFNADQSPNSVEALISINNQLQQTDAAFGILRKAQTYQDVDLKETWFEKLNRWDEAFDSYTRREAVEPYSFEVTMGKMRCLHALGEWDKLSTLAEEKWARAATEGHQRFIAPLAAAAAWGMGQWELMDKYLGAMKPDSPDRAFFGAILSIHRNQFTDAQLHITRARDGLDGELGSLLGESYTRAYGVVVRVQMLAELEEVITYKQNDRNPDKQALMRSTWNKRLKGCQSNVEVWQRMLKVRALVVRPVENMEMWIRFSNLCRKSQRPGLAEKSLRSLVGGQDDLFSIPLENRVPHQVSFAILKYMWSQPGQQGGALHTLREFTQQMADFEHYQRKNDADNAQLSITNGTRVNGVDHAAHLLNGHVKDRYSDQPSDTQKLLARCYLKQGQWQMAMAPQEWRTHYARDILASYAAATKNNPKWYKAWHAWALANFDIVTSITSTGDRDDVDLPDELVAAHVVPAIHGFFKSISLSTTSAIQDTLRLLTLWFAHGKHEGVTQAVNEGVKLVNVDTWLGVIPQLIARINQPNKLVRAGVSSLLCEVGRAHPQALVYPLTVSMKSEVLTRSQAAKTVMKNMRQHSPKLVEQAELVSTELVRIAVLWHEQWHEALEEASRVYFGDDNVDAMFATLDPLHDLLDRGPQTLREVSFIQAFGRDLAEARRWCDIYKKTKDRGDLQAAWDVYYQVFKKIQRQLQGINTVELQYVSPNLREIRNLDLAVPGTYQPGKPIVCIGSFEESARVISSKQRPRELRMTGSDGQLYGFLLKGHEDIRQDERVMQLFGLVNNLLSKDSESLKRHLNIQRYSAVPLSHQCGLLGWVEHSDTLHELIRSYRESRKILINIEHRIMLQMAPDYDNLTLMQKVEVFSYAMDNTTGQDLYRVLWLKSKSSEAWLDRRTNYIRSLAVMSMVGYILGLGDRHPSNLMMDKITGNVVHIDFGDCFEVAMHREKYPERVPFRLTRMLTFAMEVSTIEGSFRTTCENVMRVLRDNKESLMAVLEAFIHDPLLTWRLDPREENFDTGFPEERRNSMLALEDPARNPAVSGNPEQFGSLIGRPRARSSTTGPRPPVPAHTPAVGGFNNTTNGAVGGVAANAAQREDPEQAKEVQNARALQVLSRVKEKLHGRDFNTKQELDVSRQVDKLILEATNLQNLCQHYVGWCSFW